jgi:hypothetical protein
MIVQTTIIDNRATVLPGPRGHEAGGKLAEAGCVVEILSLDPSTGKGVVLALSPNELAELISDLKKIARKAKVRS